MAIIPTVRCSRMAASIAFYTKVLDFECIEDGSDDGDPSFSVLMRNWKAEITCPTPEGVSRNGVRVAAQRPLEFANDADVVLFGSGSQTPEIVRDRALMSRFRLDPRRQLIGSQCSGALFLQALGLLAGMPVCTDLNTRPMVEAAGVRVLDQTFYARGSLASAGGCLASPYLAAWVITKALGRTAAEAALQYVAPVGEAEVFIAGILDVVDRNIVSDPALTALA